MDFSSFTADGVQEDNIAGLRRFWKVLTKSFTGEYPAKAHVVGGEVTADVLAFLPQYFEPAEYILPNDTKGFDYELGGADGSEGFKHMLVYEKAGHNNALVAEMQKDMNARAVYFVEDTAGQIIVVGSSVKGLKLTSKGGSGKMGGEKRGAVMTAEETGFKWAPVPMSEVMKAKWMLRMAGFGPFFQHNVYFNNSLTVGSTHRFSMATDMGVLLPTALDFIDDAWVLRVKMAYEVGDTVIITKGNFNTLPTARTSMSLKDEWARATIVSFPDDTVLGNCVEFNIAGRGVGVMSYNFFVFHKDRTTYTGLTVGDPAFVGEWDGLNYAGGALGYVAGTKVFLWNSDGVGNVIKILGTFVSQVGGSLTINVTEITTPVIAPTPAATTGWHMMEDVV